MHHHEKDGSLWLCAEYCGLNKIFKRDHYPLPFISNLLTSTGRTHAYTALDLQHAYYFVCIADGDE